MRRRCGTRRRSWAGPRGGRRRASQSRGTRAGGVARVQLVSSRTWSARVRAGTARRAVELGWSDHVVIGGHGCGAWLPPVCRMATVITRGRSEGKAIPTLAGPSDASDSQTAGPEFKSECRYQRSERETGARRRPSQCVWTRISTRSTGTLGSSRPSLRSVTSRCPRRSRRASRRCRHAESPPEAPAPHRSIGRAEGRQRRCRDTSPSRFCATQTRNGPSAGR